MSSDDAPHQGRLHPSDVDDPSVDEEKRAVLEQEKSLGDDDDELLALHDGGSPEQRRKQRLRRLLFTVLGAVLVCLLAVFAALAIVFSRSAYGPTLEACTVEAVPVPSVSDMTLEEKVGQMIQVGNIQLEDRADIANYFIGSVLSGGGGAPSWGNEAKDWADMVDDLQQKTKRTRLRIPIVYGADAVHGHNNVLGATIFPHHVGMGAARSPQLMQQVASLTAKEVMGTGVRWTFSPCVAVCQDPRWGRCYESFSSSPSTVTVLGLPEIIGFQSAPDAWEHPTTGEGDSIFIAATAKHFVADGGTKGGKDRGDAVCSEDELRDIHLPPYSTAVEAGVSTVMASYSSWNGVPMHMNKFLLKDVLREELGFSGVLVSDWGAVELLPGNYSDQVRKAINAGIDMVMAPTDFKKLHATLVGLVHSGVVPQERVDDAVDNILRLKKSLGLFNNSCAQRDFLPFVGAPEHRRVARDAVRSTLVLLKNERRRQPGQPLFPINPENKKILVVGRHANDIGLQCGGWTITWQGSPGRITQGTTILEGFIAACEDIGPSAQVIYQATYDNSVKADYAFVFVGEEPYAEMAGDSQSLALNDTDTSQVQEVCNGMPCVLVLVTGRALHIEPVLPTVDALVVAWLPGSEGGGVADVLIGEKHEFRGRLPMPWFGNVSQSGSSGEGKNQALFAENFGLQKNGNLVVGLP